MFKAKGIKPVFNRFALGHHTGVYQALPKDFDAGSGLCGCGVTAVLAGEPVKTSWFDDFKRLTGLEPWVFVAGFDDNLFQDRSSEAYLVGLEVRKMILGASLGETNDVGVPEEEMLLAEVLAWCEDNDRGYVSGVFHHEDYDAETTCHCAAGALAACLLGDPEEAGNDDKMDSLLPEALKERWYSWSDVYVGSDGEPCSNYSVSYDFGAAYRAYFLESQE